MLQDLVDKTVLVRLKWGETEYKGRLVVSSVETAPA
jgi:small nuclear ribonucleoprotein F